MLDEATRTAILRLSAEGHGSRAIAKALGISRGAVRTVLDAKTALVPRIVRPEKADAYREAVVELYASCKGNLVRVHEELAQLGAQMSYQALTAFCRRHGIGRAPPQPAGRYDFAPGVEMQHDTSPHEAVIGGRKRRVQTASLVLCYSRMIFIQLYPSFTRFACKLFLTDAISYFGGAAKQCMIDNTHVVVLSGTGAAMTPVPEMAAFGERYGFAFAAHEKGDANRSARVERPFDFVENNFLAGREFQDWEHVNREAVLWCDRVNAAHNKRLHASHRELLAAERPHLTPLPVWVPEVYVLHQRIADLEGYINLNRNRYSVPYKLIGRHLEVRELKDRVDIYEGPRLVASHARVLEPNDTRVTDPAHRPARGEGFKSRAFKPVEEQRLAELAPELADYVAALKARPGGATRQLRTLLRLVLDYPREPLIKAIQTAAEYHLYDLARVERMLLRSLGRDYFLLPAPDPEEPDEG